MNKRGITSQFFRFSVVGTLSSGIHLALLYILTEFLNLYYLFSSFLGYLVAASMVFMLQKKWAFNDNTKCKTTFEYAKFLLIATLSLVLSLILLYVFTEFVGIYYVLSQLIAKGMAAGMSFLFYKFWVFRKRRRQLRRIN